MDPDGSIYIVAGTSVKKYQMSGTLLWEKNIQVTTLCTTAVQPTAFHVELSPDYSMLKALISGGPTCKASYEIVRLNTLGDEVGRIVRNAYAGELKWPGYYYVTTFEKPVAFQVDALTNIYVIEQYLTTGTFRSFLPIQYDNYSIVAKYNTSNKLEAEVNSNAPLFEASVPFFVSTDGSITLTDTDSALGILQYRQVFYVHILKNVHDITSSFDAQI